MPFIGQDWRAPGETWIRTQEGWERMKLRPYKTASDASLELRSVEPTVDVALPFPDVDAADPCAAFSDGEAGHRISTSSNSDADNVLFVGGITDDSDTDPDDDWQPHCFVKTNKSKEFVGCTSVSEAFHKLDLARAVTDVQRFNYVCKVVQLLIREKLQNLSGSARKVLLSVVEAVVLRSIESYTETKTVREMLADFVTGLGEGQHYGSPKLLHHHQGAVSSLFDLLASKQPGTPAESTEESVTFVDLPRECLREVLRRLPDHASLLEAAKAHEALRALVQREQHLWRHLVHFHFRPCQVRATRAALTLRHLRTATPEDVVTDDEHGWRHVFFEMKKHYGLKEVYADMIHICCHCKALFWKVIAQTCWTLEVTDTLEMPENDKLGHPCVSSQEAAPSVRVTPLQFVDMLMFL